jgi:uncharacterized membrane-anchored protein
MGTRQRLILILAVAFALNAIQGFFRAPAGPVRGRGELVVTVIAIASALYGLWRHWKSREASRTLSPARWRVVVALNAALLLFLVCAVVVLSLGLPFSVLYWPAVVGAVAMLGAEYIVSSDTSRSPG